MSAATTIKTERTEGFPYPMYNPIVAPNFSRGRPDFRRPFSDGSMTIPTSDLHMATSLPDSGSMFMNPFNYDNNPFFQSYGYGPAPTPLAFVPHSAPSETVPTPLSMPADDRSRPLSRGASTSIGKVKSVRSRSGRKGSMTDVKPIIGGGAGRVRTASNRAMSYSHPDGRSGLGLDTHMEHQRTNSISPPDYNGGFGLPSTWNNTGPGSFQSMQSFGTTIDEAVLDSPSSPTGGLQEEQGVKEEMRKARKKELHNLVEKRRREHINNNIDALAGLLPPQYAQMEDPAVGLELDMQEEEEEVGSPKVKKKNRRSSVASKLKDLSHCKGRILEQSVQYIQELKQVNDLQASRIQQLESLLANGNYTTPSSHISSMPSLFEPAGLEALRPSPEPELFGQDWSSFHQHPVFETSPPEDEGLSSGSGSISGMMKPRVRQDSQMGLRMGMGDMELESVFSGRGEDDGMRW